MIKNAKIKSTQLGFEDHGIFTCWLILDYGNSGQGFGGYCLAGNNAFCSQFIARLLKAVGVDQWEHLAGKHIRVRTDGDYGDAQAIGHIIEDRWFDPKAMKKELGI